MKYIKIFIISISPLFLGGCTENNIDFEPISQITTDQVTSSLELLENTIVGNYAFLSSAEGKYGYDRTRYDVTEYMSDDVILNQWSGNDFSYSLTYQPTSASDRSLDFWQYSYRAIYSINVANEGLDNLEGLSSQDEIKRDQLKGENIFLRSMFYFDLVRVYGRPYSHDDPATNLGVPLSDTSTENEGLSRATVKETYEFVEKDLLEAASLLNEEKSNIYVSKEVALAGLSRLYLFKEENDKAIVYADSVINSGRYQLLSSEAFPRYNRNAPVGNSETIFAVQRLATDNVGRYMMGGMMHGDGGYGQIMVSSSFMDLLFKNPNDLRTNFIDVQYELDSEGNKIPDPDNEYYGYKVIEKSSIPEYWTQKLTYQDDEPMLHSPIYFRLAEMYLIKAEAYAKNGEEEKALEMVNIIRERAGLSGDQLFRLDNLQGYGSVLDIVLDEARLEFAHEGHRTHDVFRNKKTMDRSYMTWQGWSGPGSIPYTSNRILHQIPEAEMLKNENLVQNPSYTN
ncbi:RagB/SusD family nutrient uptake outer membrane protein [Maribacter sp. ANRC-HE7]|uniref:RagB/SusD family nutrient uptake outer membrane protein n=1 Tax=Maribacter aquimaris TaxID=2737171 RepID=A0ABR7UZ69_9FLAO|nr:RagB/SusD family nutrient uptake outer membrane protein [Maribacter aquimaris]MBD0777562.1 RagB/SusD family nutrient uptake outer membrane protein [Maribacter aquimaris]